MIDKVNCLVNFQNSACPLNIDLYRLAGLIKLHENSQHNLRSDVSMAPLKNLSTSPSRSEANSPSHMWKQRSNNRPTTTFKCPLAYIISTHPSLFRQPYQPHKSRIQTNTSTLQHTTTNAYPAQQTLHPKTNPAIRLPCMSNNPNHTHFPNPNSTLQNIYTLPTRGTRNATNSNPPPSPARRTTSNSTNSDDDIDWTLNPNLHDDASDSPAISECWHCGSPLRASSIFTCPECQYPN
jgi:hypothetical protein